jgi:hypothetical protein
MGKSSAAPALEVSPNWAALTASDETAALALADKAEEKSLSQSAL